MNFNRSGLLDSSQLKSKRYTEPIDSCVPNTEELTILYVFKDDADIDQIQLRTKSHFLVGRDETLRDILALHPSISKQHAVIQFRRKAVTDATDDAKPFLIDLNSSNGTFLNGERILPMRFYEIFTKDVVTFGCSSREYVLMQDKRE